MNVFLTMRSAGTGAGIGGGKGSDSRSRDGSSATVGDVGGEGGASKLGAGIRGGVAVGGIGQRRASITAEYAHHCGKEGQRMSETRAEALSQPLRLLETWQEVAQKPGRPW